MQNKIYSLLIALVVIVFSVPVFLFFTGETETSASGGANPPEKANSSLVVTAAQTSAVKIEPAKKAPPAAPEMYVDVIGTKDASEYFYELTKSDKYEMRGVWVATVRNIDMPAGMNAEAFTKWAKEVCQNASDRNMNTIVFQAKPTADALYKSELAPWSMYINGGTQGLDPGYDPLAIMISEAHALGIELHAWINPYRITMTDYNLSALSKDSAAVKNPSWVIGYNNQFYFNPGLPEVRKYLIDCVAEIVENYDVDAIHMDDYFYPYPSAGIPFPDNEAFAKYGAGFNNVEDWRRSNVNLLVSEINKKIKEIKPYVQFGISPFGVWRNIANDPSGSNTRAGVENYDSLHADTRQWLKDGSLDYLAPQIYWSRISEAANFTVLIDWWNNEVLKYTGIENGGEGAHPINLYVGLADYKTGTNNDAAWEKTNAEITGQIGDNRNKSGITGQIHYNYSSVIKNPMDYFGLVKTNNYSSIALTPPCPWNGLGDAATPLGVEAEFTLAGFNVKIKNAEDAENTRKYVIYRFDANAPKDYKNENIVAVVYNNGETVEYLDKGVIKTKGYVYSVRSVSNTGIESDTAVNSAEVWF